MFDLARQRQRLLWQRMRAEAPGVSFFLKIAPMESPGLWVTDLPRRCPEAAWTRWGRSALQGGLLYLDLEDADYERLAAYEAPRLAGPWASGMETLQATALMLRRDARPAGPWRREERLLRETLRAMALGDAEILRWAGRLRVEWACTLRNHEPTILPACGQLITGLLYERRIGLPDLAAWDQEEYT